uniref:Uncharacterized protein n=1 Tax=Bosea sp. NBC_00436 TaxID=2969620 RepID=A0A9E7ZTM7_9HYPH
MSVNIDAVASRLREGISAGEWFEIIYHGGSRPGAKRQIAPIAVMTDRVRARCYTSNAVKPFMLDKIEILEVGAISSAPMWNDPAAAPPPPATDKLKDVRDVFLLFSGPLQAKGWAVELEEHDCGWRMHLLGFFKNGKPRKTPTHTLSYDHTTYDLMITPEGETVVANVRPRTKPWGFRSIAYGKPEKPVMDFLAAAGMPEAEISRFLSAGF